MKYEFWNREKRDKCDLSANYSASFYHLLNLKLYRVELS